MSWLDELKPSDEVIVRHGRYGMSERVDVVERVTATQIIVAGTRFNKHNGRERGRSYAAFASRLVQSTPEKSAEIRLQAERSSLLRQIESTKWRDLDLETLRRVAAALAEADTLAKEQPNNAK